MGTYDVNMFQDLVVKVTYRDTFTIRLTREQATLCLRYR